MKKVFDKCCGLSFSILFVASMIIHTMINNVNFHYDDAVYWSLGKACGWDVRNMAWGFRGWLLPFVFSMCYKFGMIFGSEMLGYRIFASGVFACFFSIIFKYLLEIFDFKCSIKKTLISGGICGGSFFLFFRGLLIYTLSDFYALTISLVGLIMLYKMLTYEQDRWRKVIEAFVFGLCLYGAYNIRTIYLFSMIAGVLILLIWNIYERNWLQLIITMPVCLLGIFVCSIPQILLNNHLHKNYSMAVPTEGLMLYQLQWGISSGRYATYIGDKTIYTEAGMFFVDKIGQTILEKENIVELASYGDFFKLVFKYPLDFIGIYTRHFLNMLYPFYPNQYIQSIENDKTLLLLIFYTILFIAVFYFIFLIKTKSSRWIWMILTLLPSVCILPGAVEIRFFIALHLIIYIYAVMGIKEFITCFKANWIKYLSMYVIGFILYISYAGALLATTKAGIAIIN